MNSTPTKLQSSILKTERKSYGIRDNYGPESATNTRFKNNRQAMDLLGYTKLLASPDNGESVIDILGGEGKRTTKPKKAQYKDNFSHNKYFETVGTRCCQGGRKKKFMDDSYDDTYYQTQSTPNLFANRFNQKTTKARYRHRDRSD